MELMSSNPLEQFSIYCVEAINHAFPIPMQTFMH